MKTPCVETGVCGECFYTRTCDYCNEYVGETELNYCNDNSDGDVGVELAKLGDYAICNDCWEYNKEELARAKLEDLRFQAFYTGEPDISGDELRELYD